MEDEGQSRYPKHTRVNRACNKCQKKKIRCDGKVPCKNCNNSIVECIYKPVEQKVNPRRNAQYIKDLEERLRKVEALFTSKRPQSDENDFPELGAQDAGQYELHDEPQYELQADTYSASVSRRVSSAATSPTELSSLLHERNLPDMNSLRTSLQTEKGSVKYWKERVMGNERWPDATFRASSDIMCSLATKDCAEPRSDIFCREMSIFSSGGIRWISETTGDHSLKKTINSAFSENRAIDDWKPDPFSGIFQRTIFRKLPPKAEMIDLLKEFFRNFNSIVPLFSESYFTTLVERQYTNHPCIDVGWWASLNITLALAYRLRLMTRSVTLNYSHVWVDDENQKSWDYLKNALAVFTELTWRTPTLLSIQALLGMVLFMQGYPNPEPMCSLLAVAIRLSHSLGLHCMKANSTALDPIEFEQRKRVFWIAYRLDKDICFRLGRPILQDDDDMNVELPSEDPSDQLGNVPLANGKGKMNLFRLTSEFSRIEARVYKQLYSQKALELSDEALLHTIGELDRQIEEWKNSIPIEFRPDYDIEVSCTSLVVHIVALHLSYYNTLRAIHRTSVNHRYWTSNLAKHETHNARPLNPRVFSSQALCVSAARASIHLIHHIPLGNHGYPWRVLYYLVSAFLTLFTNILQNPTDLCAQPDTRLMSAVINFLSEMCPEEHSVVKQMLQVCSKLECIARFVLERAEQDAQRIRKRRFGQDHSELLKLQQKQSFQVPLSSQSASISLPTLDQSIYGHSCSRSGVSCSAQQASSPHTNNDLPSESFSQPNNFVPQDIDCVSDAFLSSLSQYTQDSLGFDYEKLDDMLQGGEIVLSDLFDAALGVGNPDSIRERPSGRFI